jgi:hypothetical protein
MTQCVPKCIFSIDPFDMIYVIPKAPSHNPAKEVILIRQGDLGGLPPDDFPGNILKSGIMGCHVD